MEMTKRKKRLLIAAGVFIVLIVGLRIALPSIILKVVNKQLTMIDDYEGHVDDVDLFIIAGCYKIQGIELNKTGGEIPVPFFAAEGIDISLEWKALFQGAIVGEIEVNKPMLNFVKGPTEETSQTEIDKDWTQVVDELMPLRINKIEIKDGEVHYRDFHSDPKVDIFLHDLQVVAKNLTNAKDEKDVLPASATASAQVYGGSMNVNMKLNPLNATPTFDMNAELKSLDLTELNDFLRAYGRFDIKKGSISVYAEAAAKDSAITGYVKPMLVDLDVVQWREEEGNFFQKAWESIVEATNWVLKNKKEDQLSTVAEFEGSLKGPDIDIITIIGQTLRNAFIQALYPSLSQSVSLSEVGNKEDASTLQKQYEKIRGKKQDDSDKRKKRGNKKD